MKRKLISQETLEEMLKNSAYRSEYELKEAQNVLAKTLGLDNLDLHSFDESRVVYKNNDDNSYVYASYDINKNDVIFENVEALVVDEKSRKAKQLSIVKEMLEAVYENKANEAKALLKNYLNLEWEKKGAEDELKSFKKKRKSAEDKKRLTPPSVKKSEKDKKEGKKAKFLAMIGAAKDKKDKKMESLAFLANNVLEYVDYIVNGPTFENTVIQKDQKGNVVSVKMPTTKLRNEGKILSFNWGEIGNGMKKQRENAMTLPHSKAFCEAVEELRSANAISDAKAFEESIENIIKNWPDVIYVTENELAGLVSDALDALNVNNYDDDLCKFLAEGILRNAHHVYTDRVNKIMNLANAPKVESEDAYVDFQKVVESFYAHVDEQFGVKMKVFADLYEGLIDIYRTAERRGDEALKMETSRYLDDVKSVLDEESKPELELVEDAANFIMQFVETNLGTQPWNVSNSTHITVTGDHPAMSEKAKKPYSPSADFSGDWGDSAPQIGSDDMNYKSGKYSKETRHNSWGQEGGNQVFPSLSNPYVPKPFGDYTMKGEKGVDKETYGQHGATWQSNDTWPNLQNPYVPKAETPKTYKMNHGKEKDLVVDK